MSFEGEEAQTKQAVSSTRIFLHELFMIKEGDIVALKKKYLKKLFYGKANYATQSRAGHQVKPIVQKNVSSKGKRQNETKAHPLTMVFMTLG